MRTLGRRLTALVLALVLLTGFFSALAEKSFISVGKGNKVDIYVRVFCPSKSTPKRSVGHFDLMIAGQLYFQGRTFNNPVFSYTTDGSLEIFSEADTKTVYKHRSKKDYYHGCHLYYYHTSVNGLSSVYEFIDEVGRSISSVHSHPRTSRALKCTVKNSSAFSNYRIYSVNCFYAIAKWMEIFGKPGFMQYYKKAKHSKSTAYLPKNIVKVFRKKLKKKF